MLFKSSFWALVAQALLLQASLVTAQGPDDDQPTYTYGCELNKPDLMSPPGKPSTQEELRGRHYRISLPQNYDGRTPAPLIIAFHDFNTSAIEFEKLSHLSDPRYNKDAIVMYPEASIDGRWISDGDPPPKVDDVGFTNRVLLDLEHRLCIDKQRIYATGMGTGGGMVHLAACDPVLSNKIAAYAAVNLNIFTGIEAEDDKPKEKDPSLEPWQNCDSQRKPVRILEIHTENNTVFDYYGEAPVNGKTRWPIVQWLVGWAKSECGMPLAEPKRWTGVGGAVFKTDLDSGYIFEGFSENGLITKASYHCWGESDAESIKETPAKEESTENQEDYSIEELDELATHLKKSSVIEHYHIRGFPHGWPRGSIPKPVDDNGEIKHDRIEVPIWEEIGEPESEGPISFEDKDALTFGYAFSTSTPVGDRIKFDATARVLSWFRMFTLADEPSTSFKVRSTADISSEATEEKPVEDQKKEAEQPTPEVNNEGEPIKWVYNEAGEDGADDQKPIVMSIKYDDEHEKSEQEKTEHVKDEL